MNGVEEATVGSSIGTPEVVRRNVKRRCIIWKQAKFYADVDSSISVILVANAIFSTTAS